MNRIYHTWEKWECYPAGFYENQGEDTSKSKEIAEAEYANFLRSPSLFGKALERVLAEWPKSCEHYLSNDKMNRIAWLGQASACIAIGLPSCYRGGYNQLTEEEQKAADALALECLNKWLVAHGEPALTIEAAASKTEANLY